MLGSSSYSDAFNTCSTFSTSLLNFSRLSRDCDAASDAGILGRRFRCEGETDAKETAGRNESTRQTDTVLLLFPIDLFLLSLSILEDNSDPLLVKWCIVYVSLFLLAPCDATALSHCGLSPSKKND